MEKEEFERGLYSRNPSGSVARLQGKVVGIAGAGGLGSSIAVSLLRAGVQRFILVDHDRVELSNLNRQYFFLDQVGLEKTVALHQSLLRVNPFVEAELHCVWINAENLVELFAKADLLIEALDDPEMKAMVARRWLQSFPDRYVVMGSGISGYGMNDIITTTVHGRVVICGDQKTELSEIAGLCAPRVGIVAHMQANVALELLLNEGIK
jgi:sulfur carrier protein ThiS adenylyltransferase